MNAKITLLPGDGVGAEVIDAASTVLNAIERKYGHNFSMRSLPIGGSAIENTGVPCPEETLKACTQSNAVLLGAVGGEKWDGIKPHMRPERGLLTLRTELNLYASLSPIASQLSLSNSSALRPDTLKKGVDLMLVRDISGGMYVGEHGYRDGAQGQEAYDTEVFSIAEIERVTKVAFELARARKKSVVCADRADTLTTGMLWQATAARIAKAYGDVDYKRMSVHDCAFKAACMPETLDVVVTASSFGNILAYTLGAVSGSVQMLPSAEIGGAVTLYKPIHGAESAIAGKDEINPIGAILSAAMMLSNSLKLEKEAAAIDSAVRYVLAKGIRTKDVACGKKYVSCSRMAEEIAVKILNS